MKIKAKKSDIKEAIATTGSIVGNGASVIKIITCLLVEAKDGKATFTGTNLDQTVTMTIPCETIQEGSAVVPAQFLARVIGVSDTDDVIIDSPETSDEGCGHVTFGESKYNMSVYDAKDFPKTPDTDGATWKIKATVLNEIIKNTKYAVSGDTTRMALCNLLFEFRKDGIMSVGTDGKRLSTMMGDVTDAGEGKPIDSLFPPIAVSAIVKMVSGRTDDVTIRVSGTSVSVIGDTWKIVTKVGDQAYPNWRQIVPKEYAHKVVFDRALLMAKICQVMVSCPKESPCMSMKFKNGVLSLYISDRSGTEAKTSMTVDYDGDENEIMVNPYFLQDVLSNCVDDNIDLSFTDGGRPMRFSSGSLSAIVMPVRVH